LKIILDRERELHEAVLFLLRKVIQLYWHADCLGYGRPRALPDIDAQLLSRWTGRDLRVRRDESHVLRAARALDQRGGCLLYEGGRR